MIKEDINTHQKIHCLPINLTFAKALAIVMSSRRATPWVAASWVLDFLFPSFPIPFQQIKEDCSYCVLGLWTICLWLLMPDAPSIVLLWTEYSRVWPKEEHMTHKLCLYCAHRSFLLLRIKSISSTNTIKLNILFRMSLAKFLSYLYQA